jgi:hypothetical protein
MPPFLRETVKDHCLDRSFRRDVYVRGLRRIARGNAIAHCAALQLALVLPRHAVRLSLDLDGSEAGMPPQIYEPIFDARDEAPRRIGELLARPAMRRAPSLPTPAEIAGILVGSGQAAIAQEASEQSAARTARFDSAIADTVIRDASNNLIAVLGSPVLTTGLADMPLEVIAHAVALAAPAATPPEIVAEVLARLAAAGETLLRDGKPIAEDAELRRAFAESLAKSVTERLPLWRSLRMI